MSEEEKQSIIVTLEDDTVEEIEVPKGITDETIIQILHRRYGTQGWVTFKVEYNLTNEKHNYFNDN